MQEIQEISKFSSFTEIFFISDSLTGQDAVNTATSFSEKVDLTGIILTRLDGDGRGGAALSMKETINKPIKFKKDVGIEEITRALNSCLEEMILRNPGQWIWSHNRWKK